MSDDKPQDDNTPEEETASPEQTDQPAEADSEEPAGETEPPRKSAGAGLALLLAVLGLLGVAGIGAGGYTLWQQLQQQQQANQRQLGELNQALDKLQQQSGSTDRQQDQRLEALTTRSDNLREALDTLLKSRSHLRNDWLLTEAEYLLKLANHRLLLERDVDTAIVALQSADERLREVADPGLLAIRKRIAEDINALRNVAQPDLAGISFTLSSLAEDIPRLPLATPDPATRRQQQADQTANKVDNWRELPAALWRDIRSLVVIRHHDEPIQPLLAPEQRFFLIQNLQLQLEQARLALLNGQTRVYGERLEQARQWVEQYFDDEAPQTRQLIDQLNELAGKEIHPALPDISSTHQALADYRQQQRDSIPPAEPADDTTPAQEEDSPSS